MTDNRFEQWLAWAALGLMIGACGSDDPMTGTECTTPPCPGTDVGPVTGQPNAGTVAQPNTGGAVSPGTGGTMAPATGGTMAPATGGTTAPVATGGTMAPATGGTMAATGGGGGMMAATGGMMAATGGTGGMMAATGGMMAPTGGTGAPPVSTLPPVSDYTDEGPFSTTMESNVGPGNNYTVFRPDPMGEDGFLHAPIIFGPGILTTPSLYATLLNHLSSHGFVTIVVNSLGGFPGSPDNVDAMQTGLDWLIEQNSTSGPYEGVLAVDRATTMGYSLGATASVQLSSHEAIMTTVSIHGHNTSGDPHGPVLLLTGTSDVIDDVRDTLTTLDEAPAVMMALPIGHLDVLGELGRGGRYIAPITAWLRYWINGDEDAKNLFWGSDCEMCTSPWITPEPNSAWEGQSL